MHNIIKCLDFANWLFNIEAILSCVEWKIWLIDPMKMGLWLTHWGRVTHICVVKLTIIGSDNGLSPGRRQAIIWTNVGILLIGPLGTNFSEILFGIQTYSFKKMHLKMSSAKWHPFCLGLNVLMLVLWLRVPPGPRQPWHCNLLMNWPLFNAVLDLI